MDTLSYTTVRNNFAHTMDQVCENHNPVIVTRNNANSVVLLSLEDYQSMKETNYLLSSPKNAARLMDAVNEIELMISNKKKISPKKK